VAGEGTLEQVRGDLAALEALGAAYVLLDTFTGDADGLRRPEPAWRMLATVAERVVDLERGTLRERA
jgi:hypothetical protein